MSKIGILLGAGIGYVLGTRDGRERYEQIQQQARRLWKNPQVQQTKDQAVDVAKEKGSQLQDKASQRVEEKRSGSEETPPDFSGGDNPGPTLV